MVQGNEKAKLSSSSVKWGKYNLSFVDLVSVSALEQGLYALELGLAEFCVDIFIISTGTLDVHF